MNLINHYGEGIFTFAKTRFGGEILLIRKGIVLALFILAFTFKASATKVELGQCLDLRKSLDGRVGNVECLDHYHHFNSGSAHQFYKAETALKKKQVRISTFNVYQAGSPRTEFKDLELIAKMMNHWDVVGATELVSVIGIDKKHNQAVREHISILEKKYTELTTTTEKKEVQSQIKLLKKQFVIPGYVKILEQLRKLDPSWALLLTSTEEGSKNATVKELSGYYYRAKVVKPVINEYCKKYYNFSKAYGCYPKFSKESYGKDVAHLFARRPFLGSFRSGSFDFTLVLSHVVFNAPSDEELRKEIIKAAYGVEDYSEVGGGISSTTFARFAEITHMLKMMSNYRENFKEQDLILLGDFNLEAKNPYWSSLFAKYPGSEIRIEEPTSIAKSKILSDGTETNGTANNYDHFVLDVQKTSQCAGKKSAKVFNFLENSFRKIIDRRYLVRTEEAYVDDETELSMFYLDQAGKEKALKGVDKFAKSLKDKKTVKRGEIVDRFDIKEKGEDMIRKLYEPQLFERSYYRYFQETISDHLPVYMNCSNHFDND